MKFLQQLTLVVLASFSLNVSASELNIYWSTDGAVDSNIARLALDFKRALKLEAGLDSKVVVANAKEVNQAVSQQKVDLIITCNEVTSEYGIPLERLSQKAVEGLSCVGGNVSNDWALAVDQGVERENSGEYWVYLMRNSAQATQARALRAAMQHISEQLKVEEVAHLTVK